MKFIHQNWIPVRSPGVSYYAQQIIDKNPFSFCRYGEGEWRVILPNAKPKTQECCKEWREESARQALRDTLINCHDHDRYWPAPLHQRNYYGTKRMGGLKKWIKRNVPDYVNFHWGRVWRDAIERGVFGTIIDAIRTIPFVVVGPKQIRPLMDRIKIDKFIEIDGWWAYYDRDEIAKSVLDYGKPALISFSAGGTSNLLIHKLFPLIGHHSFLIDFGAVWEGLCGIGKRGYLRRLGTEKVLANWGEG